MRRLDVTERELELQRKGLAFGLFVLGSAMVGGIALDVTKYFNPSSESSTVSVDNTSLEDFLALIQKKMEGIPYYQQQFGLNGIYADFYLEKLEPFLTLYYPYLGDDQLDTILYFVETQFPMYDLGNSYNDEAWRNCLGALGSQEFSGHGLRRSLFSVSELTRADSYQERYYGASHELFTLLEVVGYENLMSVLFESDEEKIVDVICKETSIDSERAHRLVQLFDFYYQEKMAGDERNLCSDYLDEMRILLTALIQAKSESDPEFNRSVIGYILTQSNYMKEDGLIFEINRLDNDGTFFFQMDFPDYGLTTVRLPMYYLKANVDPTTMVDSAACYIIQVGYDGYRNYDQGKTLELLSYIVGWNQIDYLADFDGSVNQKKQRLYQSLQNYFSSEEAFNQFLIALNSENEIAIDQYFSIWKSQMMSGPITYRKLLEYNSLRETIIAHRSAILVDDEEIFCTEEKKPDMQYEVNDYYFYPSEYDYMVAFDEVMDYFHTQNSSYTELISEDGYWDRDWHTGSRTADVDHSFVLSQPLTAKEKDLGNGHTIYYYVKPEGSGSGSFVYAYTNVLNQRVETPVLGISMMLENEETGEMEDVMIVSMDEEIPYGEAYYKFDYLKSKDQNWEYFLSK